MVHRSMLAIQLTVPTSPTTTSVLKVLVAIGFSGQKCPADQSVIVAKCVLKTRLNAEKNSPVSGCREQLILTRNLKVSTPSGRGC